MTFPTSATAETAESGGLALTPLCLSASPSSFGVQAAQADSRGPDGGLNVATSPK